MPKLNKVALNAYEGNDGLKAYENGGFKRLILQLWMPKTVEMALNAYIEINVSDA